MTRVVRPDPYWLVAVGLVVADQLTKYLVGRMGQPLELPGLSVGEVINQEGVFGLDVSNEALIAVGVLICVAVGAALILDARKPPARLGCWLLLGGAFSNTLDRIFHGGVVDIISIVDLSRFNLADVMILLGALSLLRALWWKDTDGRAY